MEGPSPRSLSPSGAIKSPVLPTDSGGEPFKITLEGSVMERPNRFPAHHHKEL